MRLLLDTQAVLLAYLGETHMFSRKIAALLADPGTQRLISTITVMEISLKNSVGKLKMGEAEMRQAIRDLRLELIDFKPSHAYRLFALSPHHRDPFDRMIIATALAEGIPLVGGDREFKKYKGLKVIW